MSVILQAPYPQLETASILPNPQMSDVQAQLHEVEVRRSMNNTKRTYVKSTDRELITHAYRITRGKSLELEAFINAYYGSKIKMVDHDDIAWLVYFGSNPFEFNGAGRAVGVPGDEMQTITVTYEGERQ